jgi:parallel beta-helix repeat protein
MTLQGDDTSIIVEGGVPILRELVFDDAGVPFMPRDGQFQVIIHSGSTATFADKVLTGGAGIAVADLSDVLIEDNVFNRAALIGSAGDHSAIRGNVFNEGEIYLSDPSAVTIEGNTVQGGRVGLHAHSLPGEMHPRAIDHQTGPLVEGNTITQPDPGIAIQAVCLTGTIRGNTIEGANVGIQIVDGASPQIIGNTIHTDGVAFEIHEGVEPTLSGNDICGANAIMAVTRGGMPVDLSGNTVCEDVPLVFD